MEHAETQRPLVVIIDDDDAVRDSLRFLLETAGFDVDTFASAGQFLSFAYPSQAACLLIDQHMPGITGLELLRRLRNADDKRPAALMTGSPSAELTRLAMEVGAREVLEKPVNDRALFQFVQQAQR